MAASQPAVAVVGLGIMGAAIARNLVAAKFAVGGFDIDPGRLAALAADGVLSCGSAAAAARGRTVLLTSLPSAAALDATVESLLAEPSAGLVVAELSTLPIAAKEAARRRLAASGMTMLDCPLSGTGAQAERRDIAVYASGEETAYDVCREVFAGFARASHYLGEFGNGSRMKFVANLLVAVHNVATAEAIALGTRAGLAPARILEVIASGAGTSRIFELRGPMMAEAAYRPATMKIDIWQKDMAIIGEFARALGVPTPTFSATQAVYDAAQRQGHGADDVAAVYAVIAGGGANPAGGE